MDEPPVLSARLPWILAGLSAAALVALLAVAGAYAAYFRGPVSTEAPTWGQFGDFIGGTLNPLYSLLGLFALLLTIVLQNQQLTSSARDLERSVRAMERQASAIQHQNFERTFFEMVRLHHDIVRALDLRRDDHVTTVGRDCFRVFYERFRKDHSEANRRFNNAGQIVIVTRAWEVFFREHQHEIGHYFRNFHRILKFVDESEASNKVDYTGILRAQMSTYELALLFYNAIHPTGAKMKPMLERYQMFENIDASILCNPPDEIPLIDRGAFGDKDLSAINLSA